MTSGDLGVDLTVRGGGIFGLSIAWEAIERGAKVRLIESDRIGAGASGGLVGALSPHAPEGWTPVKALQLRNLLGAEAWWAAVEAAGGVASGYARVGRLQPLADAASVALAEARGQGAATLWQGAATWRVIPATGAAWEPASPSGYLIHDTLSARISPRRALAALEAALRARGCQILLGEAAETASPVIWATGASGLTALGADLGRKAGQGVKGQAVSLRLAGVAALPQLFVEGLHIVPHADGSVAIGSTTEADWQDLACDAQADALVARARAALPVLCDAPEIERWAGLRPRAASRGPLLGPWPGRQGHFIANGGFKIGFGVAAEVARLIVDLVLEGRDEIPATFLPSGRAG